MDIRTLIGEIAAQNGIRVDQEDPIFAVSTINRLMLDDAVEKLIARIRDVIREFETSARDVDNLAGKHLAEEVRKSALTWKDEIAKDIKNAGFRSSELIKEVHLAHSRPNMIFWGALGLIAGLCLFGCGLFFGMRIR